jgi:hypothetical protein
MRFVPSLDLSRALYEEQIEPLMADRFPNLRYAAATYGMCSETIGLDDPVSMDHQWGPRVTVLLSEPDRARFADAVMSAFKASFPARFKGFDMMWAKPGVDIHDTRETILYNVWVSTVASALRFCGGTEALPLQPLDWLRISEQHLFEFTAGVIYRDDTGEFTGARETLAYYPDEVLRFLLASEWSAVGGDWFPIGRIAAKDDKLGLRVQAARLVRHLMRVAFMVSKRYMPYKKWFGSLFKALPIATSLEPVLLDLLQEPDWQRIEERLGDAAAILLRQQNQLALGPEIALDADTVDDGRHHVKYGFGAMGQQLTQDLASDLKAVLDSQVFWLHERSLILWNGEVGKWSLLLQQ